MKNLVSIVEIPTNDFERAVKFYETILGITIEVVEAGEDKLGMFPHGGEGAFVQLLGGEKYTPSVDGTTIYLNAGDDLQPVADKAAENGAEILVPKSEIPGMGFYAVMKDVEGNKVGLYSTN